METQNNLFVDFAPVSKEEWLKKVEKDLKGRSINELNWVLEHGLELSPFFHADDLPETPSPLSTEGHDWEIGEYIEVHKAIDANQAALEGLNGGVEALGFQLKRSLDREDLNHLLEGIDMRMIATNFGEYYPDKNPMQLIEFVADYIQKNQWNPNEIRGSIDFDPILDWAEPPYAKLAEAIKVCAKDLPRFKVLQVNGIYYHAGAKESTRELAYILAKTSEYLYQLSELGISPSLAAQHMQISVAVSQNYFVEISKLRALRLLLRNLFHAYDIPAHLEAEIVVHMAKDSQDENPNTNMIRATTQAMAAVIGGADRLYVLPANVAQKEAPSAFTKRIARNIQHMLKMESFLNKVTDPAAGSYYIENLTQILAERAWKRFQELEKEGVFK